MRSPDTWQRGVVERLAWVHVAAHRACTGFAMYTGARAWCGACGWGADPRGDADPDARYRFALGVLAVVGEVVCDAALLARSPELARRWRAALEAAEAEHAGR